ncbi:hypothetical protein [Actinophytocola sp.]|uniref:hypothetical protein n=1 Tax=Actinophytocola sp. TaxID=1872138 RepID=UPI002ED2C780
MTDFRVAPEALRRMATEYVDAGNEWAKMIAVLDAADLGENDLGLLGQMAQFPAAYDATRNLAVRELKQGQEALADAGRVLSDVAKHYEEKDFEFYKKFGYLDEMSDAVANLGAPKGRQR